MNNNRDIVPGLFSNTSAFGQASRQLSLTHNEEIKDIEKKIEKITSAMDLDLESLYAKLDESLLYINDPAGVRLVEDVRDEIYRNLR